MAEQTAKKKVRLVKERRRDTWIYFIILVPIVIFSGAVISYESYGHMAFDLIGYFLVVIGVLGRSYSSIFIAGRKNSELVTYGMFSVVRNPLYFFSLIGILGVGLESGKITVLILFLISFLGYYRNVIAKEEAFLLNKFGDAYKYYTETTPRWIPRFTQWQSPETVEATPQLVLKTMLDASVFFLALPIFELFELLAKKGYLHFYFNLP